MSFWNGMKRAFGFSPEEEEEEGDYDPTLPTYAVDKSAVAQADEHDEDNTRTEHRPPKNASHSHRGADTATATVTQAPGIAQAPAPATIMTDEALPADLFDAVIKLFNEQQPEFVKTSLSTDAQRKYILDSLTDSLKSRIKMTVNQVPPQQAWNEERIRLTRRIQQLESGSSDIEALRQENRRLQLSVDRQKRALLDRINDLETQVARHNDEKEKLYTRKKLPADTELLDKANSRIAELEAEIKKLSDADASSQAGTTELEANCKKLETELLSLEEERNKLHEEHARLAEERDKLVEELKAKDNTVRQLEATIQVSDKLISDLRDENEAARDELKSNREEQETIIAQIQEQLDGFEQLKARKDAKIADGAKRITELTEENESLRHTIENNLYNQANNERDLREEIKALRSRLEAAEAAAAENAESGDGNDTLDLPGAEPRPSRRRGRPKKVRIDSSLDNTDWFASGKKDDPDFGYHEPPRRPVNDNEAQLTLF